MIKITNGPRKTEEVGISKFDTFTAFSNLSPGAIKTKDSLPGAKDQSWNMRMPKNNNG